RRSSPFTTSLVRSLMNLSSPRRVTDCALPASTLTLIGPRTLIDVKAGMLRTWSSAWAAALMERMAARARVEGRIADSRLIEGEIIVGRGCPPNRGFAMECRIRGLSGLNLERLRLRLGQQGPDLRHAGAAIAARLGAGRDRRRVLQPLLL